MKKVKVCGLLMGVLLCLMTSCFGDDTHDIDEWTLGNAQIASFSLASATSADSVNRFADVIFTIDQINGKIYNKDSMPYGTVVDQKIFCEIEWDQGDLGVMGVAFVTEATGDTIWWTSITDSVDFSSTVIITVYPFDGLSVKRYEAKLNIHQVDPDVMNWHKYSDLTSGKTFKDMKVMPYNDSYYMYTLENGIYHLYESDAENIDNWRELSLSVFPDNVVLSQITEYEGDLYAISEGGALYCSYAEQNSGDEQKWSLLEGIPSIKTLLGTLSDNVVTGRTSVLSGITVGEDGNMHFITINKNKEWNTGSAVAGTFPVSGFGSFNYEVMYHPRIVIAAGRDANDNLSNDVWATMDGLSWVLITDGGALFSPREGVALSMYGNYFFLIGGIDAEGTALKDVYHSVDQGIHWLDIYYEYVTGEDGSDTEEEVEKYYYEMPEEYIARGFSSVIIDKNNYMLLFGGKESKDTNVLNEIWRGRLNRLASGKK